MRHNIFYIGTLLLFVLICNSSCKKTIDSEIYNNDLNEVVSVALNSELVYYTVKSRYSDLLNKEALFLKNDKINDINLDSVYFLMKPVQFKTAEELLDNKNPDFYYFFDIKISEDLARVVIVYSFSPVITIYLEKDEGEWKETDCVVRYHVNLKSNKERDLINEIIYRIEKDDNGSN